MASTTTATAPHKNHIRVGVGGWTFEPWRNNFYPEGLAQSRELEYASRSEERRVGKECRL